MPLVREGNVRITIEFNASLPEDMSCVLIAERRGALAIASKDKELQIRTSYVM